MLGGAIGGGISGAKTPSLGQMQGYYESTASEMPNMPKGGLSGALKGAFQGAAEGGDEEYKRESQEFKGLQDFLEAAHGIPKNATLGKSVGELRGLARGVEAKQMQDLKLRERATDEARQKASEQYQQAIVQQQQQIQAAKAAENAADQKFTEAVASYREQYGDEGDALAYAMSSVPGISADLRNQVMAGMDPTRRMQQQANLMSAKAQLMNAEQKLAGGADDPELRTQYLRLKQSENEAMERWKQKPKDDRLRDDANAATRTRQQFERDFKYAPPGRGQQPSAGNAGRFKIIGTE
jgi:hypothetical protein